LIHVHLFNVILTTGSLKGRCSYTSDCSKCVSFEANLSETGPVDYCVCLFLCCYMQVYAQWVVVCGYQDERQMARHSVITVGNFMCL